MSRDIYDGIPSNRYRHCNHHHELTDRHRIVDFGDGEFVANVEAIPLLKALNDLGIRTRTHHYAGGDRGFVSVLTDNLRLEIRQVNEIDADRDKYNGRTELLIQWGMPSVSAESSERSRNGDCRVLQS